MNLPEKLHDMHALSFSHITEILQSGVWQALHPNNPIEVLLTDSRRLSNPGKTLFFGIDGATRTANRYVDEMYQQGVRNFILKKDFPVSELKKLKEANIILVEDVIRALQRVAAHHRKAFHYPVIGITGSNGKTIVKEWLFQLLSLNFQIVRSPKSYNSQIGVPLSVWRMDGSFNLGIFEAGISTSGEMQNLEKVIAPELGILCFMGDAHAEGFSDYREKIQEKLQLFIHSRALVFCEDDEVVLKEVTRFKREVNPGLRLMGWSRIHPSFLKIEDSAFVDGYTNLNLKTADEIIPVQVPFTDAASIYNAITALTASLYFDIPHPALAHAAKALQPVEMRLELLSGNNNCSIINDSYSADLNSLEIGLDFLFQQQQHARRTVILSDLLQSGLPPHQLYKAISRLLATKGLFRFIGIGPEMMKHKELFSGTNYFFEDTSSFLNAIPDLHFRNETILLKGARSFEFEHISRVLQQRIHETKLEINLNAIRENVKTFKSFLRPGVKLMAMVKAFSYGSGSFEIANVLQHEGVDYLAVAYADEGMELRKSGIRLPILVMNPEYNSFENIVTYNLEPELYSHAILRAFNSFLETKERDNYPVHIKLDTGMHRLGFLPEEVKGLCKWFESDNRVRVVSVFSHLAASGDPQHDAFSQQQFQSLMNFADQMAAVLGYSFIRHIANSAGIHRHPSMQLNMVRLGIGMYGVDENLVLRNVTTLKTTISQVKQVLAGESVGYNRAAVLTRDSRIAVVRIGYADGYPRILGNGKGQMLIHGKCYPVIGNVCMDMLMLDVTGSDVKEEDEVLVFGDGLPVWELARWANTIPYEILTNISQRVKRLYYEE